MFHYRRAVRDAATARRASVSTAFRHNASSGQPVRLQPRSASANAAIAAVSVAAGHKLNDRVKALTF